MPSDCANHAAIASRIGRDEAMGPNMVAYVMRRAEVERTTGLSRSSIYLFIKKGEFPKPIKLGTKAVGWIAAEVEAWKADRVAARDKASA